MKPYNTKNDKNHIYKVQSNYEFAPKISYQRIQMNSSFNKKTQQKCSNRAFQNFQPINPFMVNNSTDRFVPGVTNQVNDINKNKKPFPNKVLKPSK